MKKIAKKLEIKKETIQILNAYQQKQVAGGSYISQTKGAIYHCHSLPFVCDI
jgi:hypothetical protein